MKGLLKVLNLVYLAIATVAIGFLTINFIKDDKVPFLKVGFDASLDEESSKVIFTDEMLEEFGIEREDLFTEGNIEFSAYVEVKNKMLLDVWTTSDAVTYVDESFIGPCVDKLVADIEPTFTKVAKKAAKSSIKSLIEEQLSEGLDGNIYNVL